MTKEILEQTVLDYINEKFKDKVVDKRVQTFFTYSELVDTVLSFAELLNKNIEELEKENAELKDDNKVMADNYSKMEQKFYNNLTKAKEIIKELARVEYADFTNGDYSNELSKVLKQAEQFLKE